MPIPQIRLSSYKSRPIIKKDVDTFAKSMEKLDARHQAALQQRNAISTELAKLDLNPAEDEWKFNYAKEIQDKIDAEAQFGNYAGALSVAQTEAANAISNPALLGRLKANQVYKQFNTTLDARTDIGEDVKQWAREINPYHYEDKLDSEGNIVGGTEWKPFTNPVSTVDFYKLMDAALSNVAKDKGASNKIYYMDINGNYTTDINKSFDKLPYLNIQGSYEQLTSDKLRDAITAAIEATPGAKESLKQDYNVAVWKTKKLDDENGDAIAITDVTDDKGMLLTEEQYLEKKINPFIKSATYRNIITQTSAEAGLSTGAARMRAKAAGADDKVNINTLTSTPFGYTTIKTDNASSMFAKANIAKETLGDIATQLKVDYKPTDGADVIFNKIKQAAKIRNAQIPQSVFDAYENWKEYNNKYNQIISANPDNENIRKQQQAIEFVSALDNGIDLSMLPEDNPFKKNFIKSINAIWGNNAEAIEYVIPQKYEKDIIKLLDGTEKGSYSKLGITITHDSKGNSLLSLDRNNATNIYLIQKVLKDIIPTNTFTGQNKWFVNRIINGEKQNIPMSITFTSTLGKEYDKANKLMEDFVNQQGIETSNIPQDFVPITSIMEEYARTNGLNQSDINKIEDKAIASIKSYQAQMGPMYIGGIGDTRKEITEGSQRADIMSKVQALLSDNEYKNRITIGTDKRSLGTLISISPSTGGKNDFDEKLAEAGLDTTQGFTIYLPNAINSEVQQMVTSRPDFIAKNTLYNNYTSGFPSTPVGEDESLITNDGLNYMYDFGDYAIPVTEEQAAKLLINQKIFNQIKGAITNDGGADSITDEQNNWIKQQVNSYFRQALGYSEDEKLPIEVSALIDRKIMEIKQGY